MKIIDTHTHLNDQKLFKNRDQIIKECKLVGVKKIINNGDTFESLKYINQLASEYPDFCYSALGIFPTTEFDNVSKVIDKLEKIILSSKNVVAIGEIGLDYHYDNSLETKIKQKELFLAQIKLAEKLHLPIIIHSRDADEDTFNTIIDSQFKGNVTLHCYSSSYQMAKQYLHYHKNTYFGIGGVLTFKNAKKLVDVVQNIDYTHLVLETDAPYLAPVPYRGQINIPPYIVKTLDKLAELLNMDKETLANEIYLKSKEIYHV